MAREITPVLFFGFDDRFIPTEVIDEKAKAKHSDEELSEFAQRVKQKDFRPRPIIDAPAPAVEDEAGVSDETPKGSSATEPADDSEGETQTNPSEPPAPPADPNAEKEKTDPLAPPPLI